MTNPYANEGQGAGSSPAGKAKYQFYSGPLAQLVQVQHGLPITIGALYVK